MTVIMINQSAGFHDGIDGCWMEIRELRQPEIDNAAHSLSRGMRDNPNHLAAFGSHPDRRRQVLEVFFRAVLPGL